MTEQGIFEAVVRHLATQKKRAVEPTGTYCKYRADDGTRCAAGALLTDEEYLPEMEGKTFGAHLREGGWPTRLMEHQHLICRLQKVHDSGLNWDDAGLNAQGRQELIFVTLDFHLDDRVVKEAFPCE